MSADIAAESEADLAYEAYYDNMTDDIVYENFEDHYMGGPL